MSNIAIFSDLHVGIHQNDEKWHTICLNWLKWFNQSCKDNNVSDIIFCGDFFDNRQELNVKSINIGKTIIEYLRKNFKLHMIVGNHDCYLKDSNTINSLNMFKGLDNVVIHNNIETSIIDNVEFGFIPWLDEQKNIPNVDVLIGHLELNTFKMSGNKLCENGLEINNIISKSKLIFTGHFHIKQERKYSNNTIIYTGNPFQMDFSDINDDKGFYILNSSDLSYKFIKNTISPKHFIFKTSDIISNKDNLNKIKQDINQNIIKIIFDDKLDNLNKEKLNILLQSYNPLIYHNDFNNVDNIETLGTIKIEDTEIENIFTTFVDMLEFEYKKELNDYIKSKYEKFKHFKK